MLYSVNVVLSVCYTQCVLYLVYTVLGVYCTWCILYLAYTVLGVYYTLGQLIIMTSGDWEWWLAFVVSKDSRVVDEEGRFGGQWWEHYVWYELMGEISGMSCLTGLGSACICVLTSQMRFAPTDSGERKLTRTQYSSKHQLFMLITLILPHLSRSCRQLYHQFRTWS